MRSERMSLSTILAMAAMSMARAPAGATMRHAIEHFGTSFGRPKPKGTGALKASRSSEEVARLKSVAQAKRERRWARNLANAQPGMILHTAGSSHGS